MKSTCLFPHRRTDEKVPRSDCEDNSTCPTYRPLSILQSVFWPRDLCDILTRGCCDVWGERGEQRSHAARRCWRWVVLLAAHKREGRNQRSHAVWLMFMFFQGMFVYNRLSSLLHTSPGGRVIFRHNSTPPLRSHVRRFPLVLCAPASAVLLSVVNLLLPNPEDQDELRWRLLLNHRFPFGTNDHTGQLKIKRGATLHLSRVDVANSMIVLLP